MGIQMDKTLKYLITVGTALCIGLASGSYLGINANKPNLVYVIDLNGDNRPDLVIKTKRGDMFPYIKQEDGTYENLDELRPLEAKGIEAKLKELEE